MTCSTGHLNSGARRFLPCPGARGFTLIEIMLVVGIMGIILAMGLPAIVRTLERAPLQQAVRDVEDALASARAQAILRGHLCVMSLRADGQILVREGDSRQPGGVAPPLYEPEVWPEDDTRGGSSALFEAQLGEDIMITSISVNLGMNLVDRGDVEAVSVRFFPNGTADDFEVVLQDTTGVRRITLDPVTGFCDVVSDR